MNVAPSPFQGTGIAQFAERFRRNEISAVSAATVMLERITAFDPHLRALSYVDYERALVRAKAIDKLFAAGIDLGALMGVPVMIKDVFSIEGMPIDAGSASDIVGLVPQQGRFITDLQRAGCVLLGKTRTTEFAMGGFNLNAAPPWNPWDINVARMTGGSSHGSAVAMAAGLAGFALGTDTGGSVRWPAALCGVFGYKATADHWPQEGIFPLSKQMESLGFFTESAADATHIYSALSGHYNSVLMPTSALVLAFPGKHFFNNVEGQVMACFERACKLLGEAGVRLIEVPIPEVEKISDRFDKIVTSEWIAFFGRDRFMDNIGRMDETASARIMKNMDVSAEEYIRVCDWRRDLISRVRICSVGIDAWISPTTVALPAPCSEFRTVEAVTEWNKQSAQNTRPANFLGQCGVSLPMHHLGASLPVGLQLCGAPGQDRKLLSVAQIVENVIGRPDRSELLASLAHKLVK